jgi:Homeodomain-like domain
VQRAELAALVKDRYVYPEITRRAQMILWESEGLAIGKITVLARVSRPTLNLWRSRYREEGVPVWLIGTGQVGDSRSHRRCVARLWR